MIARFYAEYIHEDLNIGWHVFDRELTTKQGDTKFICYAINRRQAFKIRDALNAQSQR